MLVGGSSVVLKVGADLSKFDRKMSSLKGRVAGLGKMIKTPFLAGAAAVAVFTTAVTAASVALGVKGVQSLGKFEHALAEVRTITERTRWDFSRASQDLRKMSRDMGSDIIDLTKGLYQVVSAGVGEQSEAMDVLRSSQKLGVAGLASVEQSVDLVTTALNAYGLSAGGAAEMVSDLAFTTVKLGKTTIPELSASVGRLLPISAQAGISLQEVFAALAVLTQQGLKTEEAVTALRAVLTAVIKPGTEAIRMADQLGLDFSLAALRSKGFVEFLGSVKKAVGGNSEAFADLFGNVRGLVGVLALAGDQYENLQEALGAMDASFGATAEASAVMEDTLMHQWGRFKANLKDLVMSLGEDFLPIIKGFFEGFSDTVSQYMESYRGELAAAGEMTEITGRELGKGFADLVISAFKTLKTWFKDVREWIDANKERIKGFFNSLTTVVNKLAGALNFLSSVWTTVKSIVGGIYELGAAGVGMIGSFFGGDEPSLADFEAGIKYHKGGWVESASRGGETWGKLKKGEFVLTEEAASMFGPVAEAMNRFARTNASLALAGIPVNIERGDFPAPPPGGQDRELLRGMIEALGAGGETSYDNSTFNLNLSFHSKIDRETVNKFVVPQVQRAWEVGSIRRNRGVR